MSADALALSSPAACALDTAQVFGLAVRITPELAETDYGQWRGRRLADIAVEMPRQEFERQRDNKDWLVEFPPDALKVL